MGHGRREGFEKRLLQHVSEFVDGTVVISLERDAQDMRDQPGVVKRLKRQVRIKSAVTRVG
jgi:hypothetical protein